MLPFWITLAIFAAAVVIFNIKVMRSQQHRELDKGMNAVFRKHQIRANPMIIAYILFPIAALVLVAIFMYYYH